MINLPGKISKLKDWLFQYFPKNEIGTKIPLPSYTAEFNLPYSLLLSTETQGWCLHRSQLPKMIARFLSKKSIKSYKKLTAIKKLAIWEKSLSEDITYIILVPYQNHFKYNFLYEALLNHERLHSMILKKSEIWHRNVDIVMWSYFPNEWDDCLVALLQGKSVYYDSLVDASYCPIRTAWISTEEILARICAVMHAPKKQHLKRYIARHELRHNHQALLTLVEKIEKHHETPEQLMTWLDSIISL